MEEETLVVCYHAATNPSEVCKSPHEFNLSRPSVLEGVELLQTPVESPQSKLRT